jgi:hypothetical protein
MTALAGGGLQHIAFPQTSTLGEAHVHVAGEPLHVGVPPPQVVVHAPQWLTVFSGVSHPGALVQSPNPALQDAMPQLPLAQVAVAFGWVHAIPHPPQFEVVLVGVSQPSVSLVPLEQLA